MAQIKRNRKILISIGLIIAVFFCGVVYSMIPKPRYYDSIDEAIVKDKIFRNTEYLGQIESNGVCKIFYNTPGDGVSPQYLVNELGKWKVLDPQNCSVKQTSISNYMFDYSQIDDKCIISISSLAVQGKIKEVRDSVSSDFAYFRYDFPETYGQTTSVVAWMVVFDELPENYSVTVDGETVTIN